MLIVFCNKCGMRISKSEIERRGLTSKMDPDEVRCETCGLAARSYAPEPVQSEGSTAILVAQRSEVLKPPSPGTGTQTLVARPTDALTKTARRRTSTSTNLSAVPADSEASNGARALWKDPVKLGASAVAAALILVTLGAVLFSGVSKDPKETAEASAIPKSDTKSAGASVPPARPVVEAPKPAQPAPHQPQPTKPAPAVPAAPAPAVPIAPKPAAAPASELSQITDVLVLREKLRELGNKAPREELRRVAGMPAPEEPEKAAYSPDFSQKNSGANGDYGSKVEAVNDLGEAAVKITQGDDRLACYFRLPTIFTNNPRLRLRIYQRGLRDMRISLQTVYNIRFTFNFKPPEEGKWEDITVDLSKTVVDGLKLQNIVIQHIELHGFRKGTQGDPFFELSKFDVLNGGPK